MVTGSQSHLLSDPYFFILRIQKQQQHAHFYKHLHKNPILIAPRLTPAQES
jgi:hypothetical protein